MRPSLTPIFRSKVWALALSLLALASAGEAQSRPAGRLLGLGRAGRLQPARGLSAPSRPPMAPVLRSTLAAHRPAQRTLRKPATAWGGPLAPCRSLAAVAGPTEGGEAPFKPVAADDSRIRRALEDLRRDGPGLFDGQAMIVKQAWIRETGAGAAVRLKILWDSAGDGASDAGRIWLDASREAGQSWCCHATPAGQAAIAALPATPERPADPPTFEVMILCPATGSAIPTGLAMTAQAFLASEMRRNTIGRCPSCAGTHAWGRQDAHLYSADAERR